MKIILENLMVSYDSVYFNGKDCDNKLFYPCDPFLWFYGNASDKERKGGDRISSFLPPQQNI